MKFCKYLLGFQATDVKNRSQTKEQNTSRRIAFHSDQGFQYTSQAYFNLAQEYGITPSMSRCGNCYGNAMAENFLAILKTECIYRQKIESFKQANALIDDFIHFYNHERIQLKTGVAPLTLRHWKWYNKLDTKLRAKGGTVYEKSSL